MKRLNKYFKEPAYSAQESYTANENNDLFQPSKAPLKKNSIFYNKRLSINYEYHIGTHRKF